MATTFDRQQQHYTTTQQPHLRDRYDHRTGGDKLSYPQQGPSKTKVMAIFALLPIGGILLGLAGITFVGTMIGLSVAAPLFVIFSPVIVPAVLTIALAVTGFLTSGTFGLTGLSSLSYLVNVLRQSTASVPEQIDYAKEKVQDLGIYTGQKTKEMGQFIQQKGHEIGTQGQSQSQSHGQAGQDVGVGVGHGQAARVQASGKEGGKSDK